MIPERLLEIFGLVSGLVCVWLMIKQNTLTFPIGLANAMASVLVMASNQLYAQVLLYAYYVCINAYGWWYWSVSKEAQGTDLVVTRINGKTTAALFVIGGFTVGGVLGSNVLFCLERLPGEGGSIGRFGEGGGGKGGESILGADGTLVGKMFFGGDRSPIFELSSCRPSNISPFMKVMASSASRTVPYIATPLSRLRPSLLL